MKDETSKTDNFLQTAGIDSVVVDVITVTTMTVVFKSMLHITPPPPQTTENSGPHFLEISACKNTVFKSSLCYSGTNIRYQLRQVNKATNKYYRLLNVN